MNELKASFARFWEARNGRERAMLAAAAAVLLFGLVYLLLIDPAVTGREQLSKNLPQLRQQAATMQALAKEAAGLTGQNAAEPAPMTKESVEASLQRKGLTAQNVSMTGDFARVQLNSAPFANLVDWVAEAQKTARIAVTEASVNSLPAVGMVNATLTLRQQKAQ